MKEFVFSVLRLTWGRGALAVFASLACACAFSATVEIKVNLKLDNVDYVSGERVRGVIDIANYSPERISVGHPDSRDKLFVEVYKSGGATHMEKVSKGPFVSSFSVGPNEGQKLEVMLGDHYFLRDSGHYLAKPVLLHGGMRYEGQPRAFGIVPGMKVGSALQMFSSHAGLRREFELLSWNRKNKEHVFLAARDEGTSERKWITTDVGPMLRLSPPTISVLPTGEVIVLHRLNRDQFCRTEFWSLPGALELQKRELVMDPETAGSERIKELYKESGGVKPAERPWWKFW